MLYSIPFITKPLSNYFRSKIQSPIVVQCTYKGTVLSVQWDLTKAKKKTHSIYMACPNSTSHKTRTPQVKKGHSTQNILNLDLSDECKTNKKGVA